MPIDQHVLAVFLVFCRVGACLMIVPGLASARVPSRVRLLLALALSLCIAPIVEPEDRDRRAAVPALAASIVAECAIGLMLGLAARLILEAAEFAGVAISNYIGLSGFAPGIEGTEPQTALSNLVAALAVTLLMVLDFPQQLVVGLVQSYARLPQGAMPETGAMLGHLVELLGHAFRTALQISAPFLVYGLLVNLAFAIIGKLVPQVPSFFISAPFVALGGLMLLYLAVGEMGHVLISMLAWALPGR